MQEKHSCFPFPRAREGPWAHGGCAHCFLQRSLYIALAVFGRVKVLGHAVVKGASRRGIKILRPANRGFMAIQGRWRSSLLGAHKPSARLIAGTLSKDMPA